MPNMAAAKIKGGAHKLFRTHSYDVSAKSEPLNAEQKEREKRLISNYLQRQDPQAAKPEPNGSHELKIGCSSRQLAVKDFKLLKTLGTGTFARVWLSSLASTWKENQNKVFALKILRKTDIIRLKQVEHIRNERNTLAAVSGHPFITTMITSFSDRECLYMLLEYCPGGEVFTYLRRAKRFDEETSRFYAAEIVLILAYLHDEHGIAYRDLKPENILIDAEGHLKLVDFGFAKKIGHKETYTLCGTPEYLAPEVIRNSGHGMAVDWWALGILLYEFLVGQPPFWNVNPIKIYELICEGKIRYPQSMPADARSLIAGLCKVNPTQRTGNLAGGSNDVKSHPFFKTIDWDALYHRRVKGPIIPELKHAADASNFDDYDSEPLRSSIYTKELEKKYDHEFRDF